MSSKKRYPPHIEGCVTVNDIAEESGLSKQMIYSDIRRGGLLTPHRVPAQKKWNRAPFYFTIAEAKEYIKKRRVPEPL